ncbi:transcriptional activator MrkH [Klebsiella quasipneumoniae]|uniref:transcriptional activator MrkH n=1 Tax=Klebsiella quasipneumoniae TaxID=1463165 RepID=UPI002B05C822|nr:transcriptional activator MrkH [Klebsiella quasipneumoniae]
MTEGTIKTSKYEIIAIFREELRKRTEIEIFFNNTSIITQLTRVDFAEFHIQTHRKIPPGHKIRFLLHSDSGKIEFNAALTKHDNSGVDKGIRYAFSLPECLQVVQRRRDPRFRLRHEHEFYCRGRHNNGENYLFDIKDISDGGCALMTKTPNLKFLSHNALLKNAVLMLAEYGEITIDLVVKNVIIITLDNPNEESESYYQISCQFKFRHLDDQRRIEKILLDLILEAKRKKRI